MIQLMRARWKRAVMVLALLATVAGGRVWGQAGFGLSATSAPNPVLVTQPLTYFLNVTNRSSFAVSDVFVTNRFSATTLYVAASNSIVTTVTTNANDITFRINSLPGGQIALLSLVVSPRVFGALTNTVTVFSLTTTNATTNVVTQVIAGQSDLGVSLIGPPQPVLANDWVAYTLAVTNRGPDLAPGVVVSNRLPADVGLISVTVSNHSVTFTNNSLLWSVGALGIGAGNSLSIRVQPTNSGIATLLASVSAANVSDTNLVNNSASNNLAVAPLISSSLVVSNVSVMYFNPQTALMEQAVRLVNVDTNTVASARVVVSGLTNRLFNAVGTNNGQPFVVHGAALAANQRVDLLLNYLIPSRLPIFVADSQLQAVEMSAFNPALPQGVPVGITQVVLLPTGEVLIEFSATSGRSYSVLYGDDVNFTNGRAAQPSLVAPADRVQWIDYGPPETLSRPASAQARFYRVIETQ